MTRFTRILITKGPLAFLLEKSKGWYLPGFEGLCLYDVIRFFYKQLKTHGLSERAAAISYNFIMALPPSLLFLFTLIPNLPFIPKRSIRYQLHSLIFDIIPAKAYNKQIIDFVDSFLDESKIALLSFGLLLSLFFASNAMMGLLRSFNRDYVGFTKRKRIHMRGIALRLTIILFGLLLAYLILLVMQGAFLKLLVSNKDWREVIFYSRWVLIVMLIFFAFAFIYRYAPAVQKRWRFSSPGAIFATVLSILASLGFAAFVNNFGRYNALYGSIGTIMMIMALIYINSLAILIGFELNVSITSLKQIAAERKLTETNK
ncbi:MAG: YihY/virulence factor BrkB family protein [Ferruginibacter sp.]